MLSKKIVILILCLILVIALWPGYKLVLSIQQKHMLAQEQLLKIRNSITIGDTEEFVNSLLVPDEYELLDFTTYTPDNSEGDTYEILCRTPLKLNVSNWYLRIGISEGKVAYLKIQALDVVGQDDRPPPPGAPPDLFLE